MSDCSLFLGLTKEAELPASHNDAPESPYGR
jgi:hypothetical protein